MNTALIIAAARKAHGATVHGMRSSARSWAAAQTDVAPFIAEPARAHVNKDRVEGAYQRDRVIEKRRALLQALLSDRRQPVSGKAVFIGLRETPMTRISYKRRRIPPTIIQDAVWLCFRFTLSLRGDGGALCDTARKQVACRLGESSKLSGTWCI